MAEGPADPSESDLKQRVLRVLRGAGSPVKTAQLAKECQVPKKELNQVLYQMKDELQVALIGPATWCLGDGRTGDVVPTEMARPSQAEWPQQGTVAIPEKPGCQLSEQQEKIYRLLEDGGPRKALNIAQSLGMKRAKEVNPDLYAMRMKHLLDLDQNSHTWTVYRPEDSGGRNQSTAIIYQHRPVNMICQKGPNSHISIENSEAVQIGHKNVIVRQPASGENGENGSSAPVYLPPPEPTAPSTEDPLAESWGSQDIHMERSVLTRVQMGHGNKMSLHSARATGPAWSPSRSPPVSATTAGPESSFEIRMPTPGPHPEGDVAQRVHIKSCFLEDAAIGNSNRMSVSLGPAGPGGGAGPKDGSGDPGEPADGAAPHSEAAQPRGKFPQEVSHADVDISIFTSHLEAVTLESRDLEATEDGP